jgi:hypothetical protein
MDLTARRLEDLAYSLRKRMIAIDQSQSAAKHMKGQYRTIGDLIHTYKVRLAENEVLKSQEFAMAADAIIKRRRLARASNEVAGNLAVLLQSQLDSNYEILRWVAPHDKSLVLGGPDSFDDVTPDSKFAFRPDQFMKGEFENVSNQDWVQSLCGPSPLEKKVSALKSVIREVQNSFKAIDDEMEAARKLRHAPSKAAAHTQTGKLWGIADQLFDEIAQQQDAVEVSIEGEHALYHEIHQVVEEYRSCIRHWMIVYKQFADLSGPHNHLLKLQCLNSATAGTLLRISESFSAIAGLDSPVKDYLQLILKPLIPQMPTVFEIAEETLLDLQKPRPLTSLAGLLERNRRPRLVKPMRHLKRRTDSSPGSMISAMDFEAATLALVKPPSFALARHEMLLLAARGLTEGGFVMGQEFDSHPRLRGLWNYLIHEMSTTARSALESFRVFMVTGTAQISSSALPLLVIPKADDEAQTEEQPRSEAETETLTPKEVKLMLSPQKRSTDSSMV